MPVAKQETAENCISIPLAEHYVRSVAVGNREGQPGAVVSEAGSRCAIYTLRAGKLYIGNQPSQVLGRVAHSTLLLRKFTQYPGNLPARSKIRENSSFSYPEPPTPPGPLLHMKAIIPAAKTTRLPQGSTACEKPSHFQNYK
jgi:hypothetical protein